MCTLTYDTTVDKEKRQCLSNAAKFYCSQTIPRFVTVALVTSPGAGGTAYFSEGKFREYKDVNEKNIDDIIYVFISEEMDIHDISQALKNCLLPNEYIQTLIISGHGNWNKMALSTKPKNSNEKTSVEKIIVDIETDQYKELFETIAIMMGKVKELGFKHSFRQSIILDSCFTNSHVHKGLLSQVNFRDVLASYVDSNVSIYAANAPAFADYVKYKKAFDSTLEPVYETEPGVMADVPNFPSYFKLINGRFIYYEGTNHYRGGSCTSWLTFFAIPRESANLLASLFKYDESSIERIEYYNAVSETLSADMYFIKKLIEKHSNENNDIGLKKMTEMYEYYKYLEMWSEENIKYGNRPILEVIEELRNRLYAVMNFYIVDRIEYIDACVDDEIKKAHISF